MSGGRKDRHVPQRYGARDAGRAAMSWRVLRSVVVAVVALAAAAVLASCSSPPPPAVAASYYLALGDSLSRGVQPNAAGASVETGQGYPDQVYARLAGAHPGLKLVRLGCPGETTKTMMHGGICHYPGGSQLAAATAFLRSHRGHVLLVTIDIGANDPESCGSQPSLTQLASCIGEIPGAAANVSSILASVRSAAGPGVPVVGMSYYLPALAEWRKGGLGKVVAEVGERLTIAYNDLLDRAYVQAGDPVANVSGAFDTTNFGDPTAVPGIGTLPRNVALICKWTWECTPAPRGPNQHANSAGYQVIANAILKVARLGS
jgi:lysophospholipase L1-like esterase